jgi:hypothetical protein
MSSPRLPYTSDLESNLALELGLLEIPQTGLDSGYNSLEAADMSDPLDLDSCLGDQGYNSRQRTDALSDIADSLDSQLQVTSPAQSTSHF